MELVPSPDACVDRIIERVGKTLRVGAPLAAGKPNHLLNALYRRAVADPEVNLTIYTALTLAKPDGKSDLERRFLGPFVERVFGNYPDLDYEIARAQGSLPSNIRVREFYFPAGKFVGNEEAQRDYISTNYTYVARDLIDREVNVLLQQVSKAEVAGELQYSLSCNADVAPDLIEALQGRPDVLFVAQVNQELPFMFGDAQLDPDTFDLVVDDRTLDYRIFGPPKLSVSRADYAIGLYASTLIRDGGEIQIGIGSLADALVYMLRLRHQDNALYRKLLHSFGADETCGDLIDRLGELGIFDEGLFAATEMLVDAFMYLHQAGILKRKVYDDLVLQRLVNEGKQGERVTTDTLPLLIERGAVHARPRASEVSYLVHYGVLKEGTRLDGAELVLPSGRRVPADFENPDTLQAISSEALGDELKHGAIAHAGFFLGPAAFYQYLRDLSDDDRASIRMRSVLRINQLYGHESIDRLQRRRARFVNTTMMVTLLGAAASDALENGTVVSGVGGQYNFVAMAHALPGGRSILQLRSTHLHGAEVRSSILWKYGHTTIPRHQRDIVITEYGIADLRGKTDEEVIVALLLIADARFQDRLMQEAKSAGKLHRDYELPERAHQNTPERLATVFDKLEADGLCPPFPFGTDLTDDEIVVGAALKRLKKKMASTGGALAAVARALGGGRVADDVLPYLGRMGLDSAQGLKEKLYQRILAAELRADPRVAAPKSD
jgi:acyl-CoA hydrolase